MRPAADFHSHILPGVDDGSRSVEESLKMLRLLAQQGIRYVLATPHFYANHDSPERFLRRRNAAWQELSSAMRDIPGIPRVGLAAEVYYFHGISDSEVLPQMAFPGGKYILLEMPHSPWTEVMYREMEDIYVKWGITPVIAHVDRYIGPFRTHGIPDRLAQLPVLVQANAEFFLQRGTVRLAHQMLKKDKIHLLGSDCHNLKSRSPNIGDALAVIENRLGQDALHRLNSYEKMLLNMQP